MPQYLWNWSTVLGQLSVRSEELALVNYSWSFCTGTGVCALWGGNFKPKAEAGNRGPFERSNRLIIKIIYIQLLIRHSQKSKHYVLDQSFWILCSVWLAGTRFTIFHNTSWRHRYLFFLTDGLLFLNNYILFESLVLLANPIQHAPILAAPTFILTPSSKPFSFSVTHPSPLSLSNPFLF